MSYTLTRNLRTGFTLIEMVIVIAVLAILASIALPRYGAAQDEARNAAALSNRKTIQNMIHAYHSRHEAWPATIDPGWFPENEVPPHPYAPDWEGDPVQVFRNKRDPSRYYPGAKLLNPDISWGKPYWYNPVNGNLIVRVPEQDTVQATIDLFNEINGVSVDTLGQKTP
ncbi:MAG: type II secretion system protein [Planctomycetota bacterium]